MFHGLMLPYTFIVFVHVCSSMVMFNFLLLHYLSFVKYANYFKIFHIENYGKFQFPYMASHTEEQNTMKRYYKMHLLSIQSNGREKKMLMSLLTIPFIHFC